MSSSYKANILIAAVQVPFTRGGAEILVDSLKKELQERDYRVDVVQLPFVAEPKEAILSQMAQWRALDLSEFSGHNVDAVICTKFPSYMLNHPNKIVWLVHQHRQVYDLYGSRFGDFATDEKDEALRQMIVQADKHSFEEARGVFTISQNVSDRLSRYLDVDSKSVPPPLPLGNRYQSGKKGDYILSVGRICSIKRVDMMVKSLPMIDGNVKLKVVGLPDEPRVEEYLNNEIAKHHLWDRVEFLGRVSDEDLLDLYANCLAVYYAPYDEDYGFVTLEGLASSKPIVTANDSGGVLEFVRHEENGLISEPTEEAIAESCNRLFKDEVLYERLIKNAASTKVLDWDSVIETLLSPTKPREQLTAEPGCRADV